MLKGIHPLLTADLLFVLRQAGHGDEIVICDINFPAASIANATPMKRPPITVTCNSDEIIGAISTVLPLDYFDASPALRMSPTDETAVPPALATEIWTSATEALGVEFVPLERFAFYERAKLAFAIVQTNERRPYGCFILKKGVIGADGKDLKP
jgi:L-fucose mutarotase